MNPEQIHQKILFGYAKSSEKLGALFTLYRSAIPIEPISEENIITNTRMVASIDWTYMKANRYGNAVFYACLDATSVNAPESCRVGDYLVPVSDTDIMYSATAVTIVDGGTGYAVGDYIILGGGTSCRQVTIIVTSVDMDGSITGISLTDPGQYSSPLPTNPLSQYYTTGNGTGATFNVTWSSSGVVEDNNIYYVLSLQFDLPPQVVQCNKRISIIRPNQNTGAGYQGYAGYLPDTSTTLMAGMPASILKDRSGEAAPQKLPTDTKQPIWTVLIPNLGNVYLEVGDIIRDETGEDYVIDMNELTDFGWRLNAQQVVNAE